MAVTEGNASIPQRFAVSHLVGNIIGFSLAVFIILLFMMSYSIDWGVGWMVWVPAAIMMIPASALMRRRVILRRKSYFDIEQGWLARKARSFPGDKLSIELLPTAGFFAVVIHREEAQWPIATWVTKTRAQRIAAFLDHSAPTGQWPRIKSEKPVADR
jgi:hypothetical protein